MSSNSRDWSALASHNERVVVIAASQPVPDRRVPPRQASALKTRLRLRRRAAATDAAARG